MNLTDILACVGTGASLLAGLLTFLIKFVKNEKAKRVLEQTLKLTEALQPMIVKAEEFSHYNGAEKKQFVITQANQFAIEHKLKFDLSKVSGLIEELVSTTKKVNAPSKDAAALEKAKNEQASNLTHAREII